MNSRLPFPPEPIPQSDFVEAIRLLEWHIREFKEQINKLHTRVEKLENDEGLRLARRDALYEQQKRDDE